MYGYPRAPVDSTYDYVLSVNNTYSVLQRMGYIRHGADNRIAKSAVSVQRKTEMT